MGKRRLARAAAASTKEKRRVRSVWTPWAIVAGVVLVIGAVVAYMLLSGPAAAKVGSRAPDITLHLFNGQSVALSSLRGHPVLINFWGST